MVWNIQFQLAGLVIELIVIGMCLGQKRLNFAAERAFFRFLIACTISNCIELILIVAVNHFGFEEGYISYIICAIFLISVVATGCMAAWLAAAEINYNFKMRWVKLTALPIVGEAIICCFFPIHGVYTDKDMYATGVPVIFAYAFTALFMTAMCVMVFKLKERFPVKTRNAILFWIFSCAAAGLIQFIWNNLLIINFALAVSCMYMYCKLENPEYHLDFVTNVYNRKGFLIIMAEDLKHRKKKSIISIVINDLSMINEVFGNSAVDKLITSVSTFADKIPDSTLFRLEDNLFCLCIDDDADSQRVLESVMRRFESPWSVGGLNVEIKASVSYIENVSSFHEVKALEEVVHYFAQESTKRLPGDILYVNENELRNREKNIEMQHALEWALRNDGVEVFYQPIYDVKSGRFRALEALTRLRDDKGTIIFPAEFIEFAEKNGMVLRLGEVIFRKVCEFIQRMHIEQYGIDYIEVNLSVVQCLQESMSRTLKNIMGEYQVAPYRINFEITETAFTNSRTSMEKNMRDLIDYGSSFSLDDYGSGFSNLSSVVNLPLKLIKLDKVLVDGYFSSEKVRIAVESTVKMIHDLGMGIVVEGIEKEDQYLAFKELGVEFIQGYYFSRPLPKEKVLNFVQEWL